MFAPFSIMTIIDVEPGKEITWTWDQKDHEGEQVKPGVYVVTLDTSEGPLSAGFCITGLRTNKDLHNPDPEMPVDRPFKDVTGEHSWGDPHVLRLHQRNIVRGKGDDTFDPEGSLTRAEFVAMLLRACGLEPQANEDDAEESKDCLLYTSLCCWYLPCLSCRETVLRTLAAYSLQRLSND